MSDDEQDTRGELKRIVTLTIEEYEHEVHVKSRAEPDDDHGKPMNEVSLAALVGHNAGQAALHSLNHGPQITKEIIDFIPQMAGMAPMLQRIAEEMARQEREQSDGPPQGH